MFIDTHTHLYAEQFDEDRDEIIRRALDEGVEQFYMPNIDEASIEGMLALEQKYPGVCHATMGLHPCSVKANYEEQLANVKSWLDKRSFVAIGEIGVDLYWDTSLKDEQIEAFLTQVKWAKEMQLPIIIHSRESIDLIVELLQGEKGPSLRGVFHCFTGTIEQAKAIEALGFFMGIGGVLTYKKAKLDEVVPHIDPTLIVLETDAPYLSPVPKRGKRNESGYLIHTAQKLADSLGMSMEALGQMTSKNAYRLFAPVPEETK